VAGTWTEGKDVIVGESRGSTIIERYIDPSDPSIPDYAPGSTTDPTQITPALGSLYRWRILTTKQFTP
jgi:hypothetical protein